MDPKKLEEARSFAQRRVDDWIARAGKSINVCPHAKQGLIDLLAQLEIRRNKKRCAPTEGDILTANCLLSRLEVLCEEIGCVIALDIQSRAFVLGVIADLVTGIQGVIAIDQRIH